MKQNNLRFISRYKEAIHLSAVAILLALSWALRQFFTLPELVTNYLALAATISGGYPIAVKAIKALRERELIIDTLVTIAAVAAVAIGDYGEAGFVIFILLLGEFLEGVTVAKTSQAIKGLASLIPDTVKIRRGSEEVEIATAAIKIGDLIVVRPGEHIAIDGVIVRGEGAIDQALVTGESTPVERSAGDKVYSGTILATGALEIEATNVGEDTTVAKIEQMITEARTRKAPLERIVDRFAKYFVPAVLVFAVIVYLLTFDIRRAITILIVACPCALVLGTPTAVVAAIGAAARKGILIKGGRALEAAGKITTVIFDKTGTLTNGLLKVVEVKPICAEHDEKNVVELTAIAEKLSEHPLAKAILEKVAEWEYIVASPDDFTVKQGQGVEVRNNDLHIVVGNRSLLAENNIALSEEIEAYMQGREERGETVLIVAHSTEDCLGSGNGQDKNKDCCAKAVCGVISLADTIKADAKATLQILRNRKKRTKIALFTGDNARTASSIAAELKINVVAAELLPADKTRKVEELIAAGEKTAMVGDGINDAPALATADLGIAMGTLGSDITVQASDVTILHDDLASVPQVLDLGRKAVWVIRENIFFALLFNSGMIGLAALGLISMVIAAIFHQISSLIVILNSMRLLVMRKRS
ncbi:cation-translocating P-type ATPase [Candidatus Acetothermia bacterium]|nr:cation-translocating P-type ATPase [Candidatus Acetothermia bacterium]